MAEGLSATDPEEIRALLVQRLSEPAPGRIQLITGPRQVGKTTLLLDVAARYGDRGVYAAADAPEAGVPGTGNDSGRRQRARRKKARLSFSWMRFIWFQIGRRH